MRQKCLRFFIALLTIYLCSNFVLASQSEKLLTEVPFTVESGMPIIQVRINGYGPYNLGLATGRAQSVFSHEGARKLNLTLSAEGAIVNTHTTIATIASITNLEIGKLKLGNIDMYLGKGFESRSAQTLYGILGGDFLKDRVIQIDYPKSVVRFYSASLFSKESQPQTSKRIILPMRFESKLRVPIIEEVYVNDKKIKAVLDSGFSGILSLTPEGIKYLGLESEVAALALMEPRRGQVKTLAVDTIKVASPLTLFYSKGSVLDQKLEIFGGVIGNSFMQNYVVTFDYRNKMVAFE